VNGTPIELRLKLAVLSDSIPFTAHEADAFKPEFNEFHFVGWPLRGIIPDEHSF
jgi:hypothetical protein